MVMVRAGTVWVGVPPPGSVLAAGTGTLIFHRNASYTQRVISIGHWLA